MNKAGTDQRERGAEITVSAVAIADAWGPCAARAKASLCLINNLPLAASLDAPKGHPKLLCWMGNTTAPL